MKYNYKLILLFLTVSSTFPGFSQVQLNPGDLVHGGTFNMTIDSSGKFSEGSSGANKVWDFRTLKNQIPFDYQILGYSGHGNGNDANLVKVSGTDTYAYFLQTNSEVYNISQLQDFDKVYYKKLRLFNCPLQYQAVNADSFETIGYYPGYKLNMPSQDSVRLTFKMINHSVADAWGQLRMPGGDYNVLRIMSNNMVSVRFAGKKGSNPYTMFPGLDENDISVTYTWYAKDQGTYLASYDTSDHEVEYLVSSTLSVHKQSTENGIVFSNPCADQLHMINHSNDHFTMTLYDMQGQLVLSWDVNGNSSDAIDVSSLPAGFYTLQMQNARTQAISYEKVVKQ